MRSTINLNKIQQANERVSQEQSHSKGIKDRL